MIVKCASCQTRFKIGDDKVTEKGVKVRCTKCGTVFVVRKGDEQAATPAPSPRSKIPLPPAPVGLSVGSPTGSTVGSLDDLFAIPAPASGAAAAPAATASTGLDDPFAGFLSAPAAAASKSDLMPGEFALSAVDAPAPTGPPPPGATPMADLLGLDVGWPAPVPAAGPPPMPVAPLPKSPVSKPPKRPAAADEPDPFDAALDPLGSPGSVHPPPDPFASFAAEARSDDASSFGLGNGPGGHAEAGFDPLAGLSLDPGAVPQTGEEPLLPPSPEPDGEQLFEKPPPRPPMSQPVIETNAAIETTVERKNARAQDFELADDERIEKPLSAKIFNALAGASVVTLMVLAFVAYRNGGRVDLHDPLSAVFSAFGFSRPMAVSHSLTTRISDSGLYSNLRGDPILFVRGSVENLSGGPQRVGLKLEVSSQGQVVATTEGLPGLFATPEELFQARNSQEIKALLGRVFAAPSQPIPAGGTAEFLLILPDAPAGLLSATDTAELRVTAHPLVSVADAPEHAATN